MKQNEKNLVQAFAQAQFIIYGMLCIIFSLGIPDVLCFSFSPEPWSMSLVKNVFNAFGSILIVGGIFEIRLKNQFIKEVSQDFIKALFLEKSSLEHFNRDDLRQMKTNLQEQLLRSGNTHFKKKCMNMINGSFFKIAQGNHHNPDFNMYYDYYKVDMYVKKSAGRYVEVEYDLKYKLVNNQVDEEGHIVPSNNNVFAKRFFPPFAAEEETQKLMAFSVKVDGGDTVDYAVEIAKGMFQEQIVNKGVEDDIRAIQEDVKKQILKKEAEPLAVTGSESLPHGSVEQEQSAPDIYEPYTIEFNDYLIVEKKLMIKTLYSDLVYNHIFKRPTLSYQIHYIDENVDVSLKDIDYLSLRLFSGLNKKNNDKIHPILKGNSISLSVSDELLLAGEGISILAMREGIIQIRNGNDE